MSEPKAVPRIYVDGLLLPAPLHTEWSCHVCGFPASGLSERAVSDAMDEHTLYVNRQLDRATDPHFEDLRMTQLIQS
jgi:hypothetical protein